MPDSSSTSSLPSREGETVTVLSIDGGGIRGIIPALVLAYIEERMGRPIAPLFDLIAGTSTGGLLALGLTKPDPDQPEQPQYRAAELADLYEEEGRHVFSRSLWHRIQSVGNLLDEKYPDEGLEEVLRAYLQEARLKDALTEVLVTAYALEHREAYFFKRHKARDTARRDFPMREVARATAAAPTYFEPALLDAPHLSAPYAMVDGGVFANNPAMCAYVEARTLFPKASDVLVASLGTGVLTRRIPYEEAKGWGLLEWARPLLNVVLHGVSDTVDYQMEQLLNQAGQPPDYYRFQVMLDMGNDDLDDASRTNLHALKQLADRLIRDERAALDALCDRLEALRPLPPNDNNIIA